MQHACQQGRPHFVLSDRSSTTRHTPVGRVSSQITYTFVWHEITITEKRSGIFTPVMSPKVVFLEPTREYVAQKPPYYHDFVRLICFYVLRELRMMCRLLRVMVQDCTRAVHVYIREEHECTLYMLAFLE